MNGPIEVNFSNEGVQQRPMLEGFQHFTINQSTGNKIRKSALKFSEGEKDNIHLRRIEKFPNQNAATLKKHDATLKRWHDNVETAKAMCAELSDNYVTSCLKSKIQHDTAIKFDPEKNVFLFEADGKRARFKVIQGANGKHLLQVTILGRLDNEEIEKRIDAVIEQLGKHGTLTLETSNDKQGITRRTLNLGGTAIILPSKITKDQRVSFKVENNRIHFQGDQYRKDMASVFGEKNIPVNVNEGFSVNEMSNDVWRNDCMRQVKLMIFPMVELNAQYGKFLDNKKIKAPVNCLFELLSMNVMLNSVLGSQNKQHEEILKIAGELSVATKGDYEDPFESWKTTLETIHSAYDKFTKDIKNLTSKDKTSTTFIAEEAVLRRHEALLRKLFIEATNRASDVLVVDKNEIENTISLLRSEMDFSSTSGIMSNVIKMFDEQYDKQKQVLELEKKEQERKEKEEQSQQEINGLLEDVRRLTAEVAERDNQKKELIQQIDTKKEESKKDIEDLKLQIGELKSIVEGQKAGIGDLNNTIKQQSDNIYELNQTIVKNAEESKQKISDLEENIRKLDNTLTERNAKIDGLTKKIEELEAQIEDLQEKSVQPMAGGDSNATMNVNQVGSMGSVGYYGMPQVDDGMKQDIEKLRKLCEEQKRQIEEQQNEIELLKKEVDELRKERVEVDAQMIIGLQKQQTAIKDAENAIEASKKAGDYQQADFSQYKGLFDL